MTTRVPMEGRCMLCQSPPTRHHVRPSSCPRRRFWPNTPVFGRKRGGGANLLGWGGPAGSRGARFGSLKSLPEKPERHSRRVIPDGPLEAGGPPCHAPSRSSPGTALGPGQSYREPGYRPGSPFPAKHSWNGTGPPKGSPSVRRIKPRVLLRSTGTSPAPKPRRESRA